MSILKNVDIMENIWRNLFSINIAIRNSVQYFEEIDSKVLEYKLALSKSNVSNAGAEADEAENIIYWKNFQAEHLLAYEIGATVEDDSENIQFAEMASPILKNAADDVYQSESNGYATLSTVTISELNPIHEKLTNIISSIQKFNTDIMINGETSKSVKDAMHLIDLAYADPTLSQENKDTLLTYSDELQEHLDALHLDEHGEFDGQRYLEELIQNLIDNYDNSEKATNAFTPEELGKFEQLLETLRDNETSLPPEITQYAPVYNNTADPIEKIITQDVETVSDLFYQLDVVIVPPVVQDKWEEITLGETEIIHAWAGNEPESINNINNLLDVLVNANPATLPPDTASILDGIDKVGLQEAVQNNDSVKLAEYATPQVKTALTQVQSSGAKSDIPKSMLGDLALLDDNAAGALANLARMPNMNGVSNMVGDLVNLNNLGQIMDPSLSNIIGALPNNIMDLNLNNLADALGVSTNLSDLFGRLDVMNQFADLRNLIPTNVLDFMGALPPGMSDLMGGLGNLTGIDGALSELTNLIDLGQITGPVQQMLDSVLGAASLDNIVNILTTGDLSSITGIADSLGGLVDGFSSLAELPFKALDALQNIPDKIGEIVENIGGFIESIDLDKIQEMAMNLGSQLMSMIPAEAQKLVGYAQQIIQRIGLEIPSLSKLFGPGKLGDPVPEEFW